MLHDKAFTTFCNAEHLNGFDAWRRLVYHIDLGADSRIWNAERKLENPALFRRVEDVLQGMEDWEKVIREVREAQGTVPNDRTMRYKLLEMLPEVTKSNMIFQVSSARDYASFAESVWQKVTEWLFIHKKGPCCTCR